jgi:hypothetical protein
MVGAVGKTKFTATGSVSEAEMAVVPSSSVTLTPTLPDVPAAVTAVRVAVGTGTNTIAYSDDGKIWTGVPNSFFTIANAIAWNGKKWVAGGGYAYTLVTSIDGKVWTTIDHFSGIGLVKGLEYNGKLWIAGGLSKSTDYVLNGATWTIGTSWSNGLTWSNGISEASSLTATVVNKVTFVYSYEGTNWFPIYTTILTTIESIAWNGTMWIAVGAGTLYSMMYSYDGLNWIGIPNSYPLFPGGALGITWNGLRWIVSGTGTGSDSLAYSVDGLNWIGLGKTIMTNGNGIGPRVFDAKLESSDTVQFVTDSYYPTGYSNLTLGISNTI